MRDAGGHRLHPSIRSCLNAKTDMAGTLAKLVSIRSQLAKEIIQYLETTASRAAELPAYFPAHFRESVDRGIPFDSIRQTVRVVTNQALLERVRQELVAMRSASLDPWKCVYLPHRSWPGGPEWEHRHELLANSEHSQLVPWDERAGEKFPRAIILGDPGYGKTWLLRYEARRLARQAADNLRTCAVALEEVVLPIYTPCSDLNDRDDPLEEALVERMLASLPQVSGPRSEHLASFVRGRFTSKQCVMLLDALDEVTKERPALGEGIQYLPKHRQRLCQRIKKFAESFPEPRMLVACRIVEYHTSPVPKASELVVVDFHPKQVRSFVEVWFSEADQRQRVVEMLDATPQVIGLARIPLMLTLMCRLWQRLFEEEKRSKHDQTSTSVELPTQRAEIYERCLRGLLEERETERKGWRIGPAKVAPVLDLLQEIGFQLFLEGYEQFEETRLRDKIGSFQQANPSHMLAKNDAADLIELLRDCGILITTTVDQTDPKYLLLHRAFHEYLVARYLTRFNYPAELVRLLHQDHQRWWEVALLAGSVQSAKKDGSMWQLIEILCPLKWKRDRKANDVLDYRMAGLAGQIVLEHELNNRPQFKSETRNLVNRIKGWLTAVADLKGCSVHDRVQAGEVLGKLGDPRKGVGLYTKAPGKGLPEMYLDQDADLK